MNLKPFSLEEFMSDSNDEIEVENEIKEEEKIEENYDEAELSVQKAVVEEFAVEKIELNEKIASQENIISSQETEIKKLKEEILNKDNDLVLLKQKLETFENKIEAIKESEEKVKKLEELEKKCFDLESELKEKNEEIISFNFKQFDLQERNPNSLALLDRDVELPDRFPGETRDHLLEIISAARKNAEDEGRIRLAQILESVLVANEPNGSLVEQRKKIEKLFNENGNIISGPVIDELKNQKISHKNGEEYLLPAEIIKRNF